MDILHIYLFQFRGADFVSIRDQLSSYTRFYMITTTDSAKIIKKTGGADGLLWPMPPYHNGQGQKSHQQRDVRLVLLKEHGTQSLQSLQPQQ